MPRKPKKAPPRTQKPDLDYIEPQLQGLAVPIADLTPDPGNARKHDERNLRAIQASLTKHGQISPIAVQKMPDGALVVRAGNGRMEAAQRLGWTHLAAVVKDDWTDEDATAFAVGVLAPRRWLPWLLPLLVALVFCFRETGALVAQSRQLGLLLTR